MPAGDRSLGARKHLVPRRALRERAIDHDLELAVIRRRRAPIRVVLHQFGGVVREQDARLLERRRRPLELGQALLDALLVRPHRAREGRAQQRRPLQELARHLHAGRQSLLEVHRPAPVGVRVRLQGVEVPRVLFQGEPSHPPVVVDVVHGDLAPGRVLHRAVLEHGGQRLVPLAQDVGRDLERVADDALHGKATRRQLGPHAGDPHRPDIAPHRSDARRSRHGMASLPPPDQRVYNRIRSALHRSTISAPESRRARGSASVASPLTPPSPPRRWTGNRAPRARAPRHPPPRPARSGAAGR